MQLSTMRTEARLIFGEPDVDDSHFTQAQLTAWANEAYSFVLGEMRSIPISERKYTTANEVTLNANTITIDVVKFLAQPANKFKESLSVNGRLQNVQLTDLKSKTGGGAAFSLSMSVL